MKTSGFNLQNLKEDNKNIGEILNIEDKKMENPERKKKSKFNFDHLFPAPKGSKKDMNMGNIFDEKPFEGLL